MTKNRGRTLVSACFGAWVALSGLCASMTASAQVEWTTSLNPPSSAVALGQHSLQSATDGSTYSIAMAYDGETARVRLTHISPAGAVLWVRWVSGAYFNATLQAPLHLHADNSASVVYQDNSGNGCIENFSVNGDSRSRQCYPGYGSFRATLAADGDLYAVSGFTGTVTKVSALGTVRWARSDTSSSFPMPVAKGVDSLGNYYEIGNGRLRSWSRVDGALLNDVVLGGLNTPPQLPVANVAVSRSARDIVVLRAAANAPSALVANVARYNPSGATLWSLDVVFPAPASSADRLTVAPADNDSVYVVRSTAADGDSQIAKVSGAGAILWQKHYSRIRNVVEGATGLIGIRTDADTASNDSYVFAISAADGALGSPVIYSRAGTSLAPSTWFALTGGVAATFQDNNPFPPYSSYPQSLAATTVFIGSLAANRWTVVAEARPSATIHQSDCLMPRLGKSSPTLGWARTQAQQVGDSTWTSVTTASGSIQARTALAAAGCGAPITADGGRVVVDAYSDRVKKVDAAGAAVWQTPSTVYPSRYGGQPLQSIAANGEITYALGSLVGRATSAGTLVFEAETNRGSPRYLGVDSTNNSWVVSTNGGSDGYVTKVSPAGAVLWSTLVDTPSCDDRVQSALLTPSNEMLITTQSCGEGRLFKINATGQIAWQRIVSGTALRPYIQLSALNVDGSGNIYAGGCSSKADLVSSGANAASLVASWSGAGSERWVAQADLIGGASECVTSLATDTSGNVYAASSSSVATKAPLLWALSSAGSELWRHSGVLSSPFAGATELAADSAGKIIALGEALPGPTGGREVTLRRINVATLGSALRLKFLEVPSALVGYREPFPVRIGLRTAADVAVNAAVNTVVTLGLQTGSGALDGSLSCTIVVGTSECSVTDVRYDVVEAGVTLTAVADGFSAAVSAPISFKKADTSTVISVLSSAPYNGFSVVRVRAAVLGPAAPAGQGVGGSLSGPRSGGNLGTYDCTGVFVAGALTANECNLVVRSSAMPLSAEFSSFDNRYANSVAAALTLPVSKVAPTLQVTNDPANTYVAGDRLRFRVALLAPGGFNATQFVDAGAITITGGTCDVLVAAGQLGTQFSGTYRLCQIAAPTAGTLNASISFAGDADLLPAGPSNQTVTINAGAVLRGTNSSFPSGVTVCSPTPGVTCGFVGAFNNEWQCAGPSGMSGQVFFVPSAGSGSLYFPSSPVQFSNVVGLTAYTTYVPFNYGSSTCNFDVDGDGARMSMTDGILILRRMLGLTGSALVEGATHACVPRSAAGIAQAITLTAFDIDGDGQTTAATDGLLLLRAMLGFRGDALIAGAIGANATRRTVNEIQNFFGGSCGYLLN